MYNTSTNASLTKYHRFGIESRVASASNHELIALLFSGLQESLLRAVGAMKRQDKEEQAKSLSKATRLLIEGLCAGLDTEKGGEISRNLRTLYEYSALELAKANVSNDPSRVEAVADLIRPIAEAWGEIEKKNPPPSATIKAFTGNSEKNKSFYIEA